MGFGVGLVLLTTGAVLVLRVSAEVSGVDVKIVGVVLVVAGLAVLALSALLGSWGGPVTLGRRREE